MLRTLATALLIAAPVAAQDLLNEPTGGTITGPVPAAVLESLGDPFFEIVIAADPQPRTLDTLLNAVLEGGQSNFQSFVVGEQIGRPELATECGPATRRLVISFTGTHAPSGTILDGNVFLSMFMTPTAPVGDIEVLAWDTPAGTYNYYKLEGGTWRFRNRSSDLETASPGDLAQGCLACHVNGGPVMKEFAFPWTHWHGLSNTFQPSYLQSGPGRWPVAASPILGARFTGAQVLEAIVQSSTQRFVDVDIRSKITTAADGSVTVTGLPGLLDSLFQTTELNLGSSNTASGLDRGGLSDLATGRMNIPDSFFLNIFQMRDIGLPVFAGQGLVTQVFTPGDLGLSLAEIEALLSAEGIDTACTPGRDTMFPWFGPEPSEFDRRMVARLVAAGLVDAGFVAAALAIDLETPLFSEPRASLLVHVPETITAPSRAEVPAALRRAVIDSLQAVADRTAAEDAFLTRLQSSDPVAELDTQVRAYIARTQGLLADPATRAAHLETLFAQLLENREAFATRPISARLNEFPGLLPTR